MEYAPAMMWAVFRASNLQLTPWACIGHETISAEGDLDLWILAALTSTVHATTVVVVVAASAPLLEHKDADQV